MNIDLHNDGVTLIAVTKTIAPARIIKAYRDGIRHFGENRVGEADEKISILRSDMPDAIWHMVGHVQSNKVREVVRIFDWVDSIDTIKIAKKINELTQKKLHVLLEVNLSGETQRYGCDISELDELTQACDKLSNLNVEGIMIMPPPVTNPEDNRQIFRMAKKLFDAHPSWKHLSMGTSQDYTVAIREGATMVRLGTALFGERIK